MPLLLRRDATRLFEASAEALSLALVGLGLPQHSDDKVSLASHAPHIGLIGTSAELAMSACLVQANGPGCLMLRSGQFKSGPEILDDFRRLLRQETPRVLFLVQGLPEGLTPRAHLDDILARTVSLRILFTARAGGLHAGKAPSREVCIVLAQDVAELLTHLALSRRIKPYLSRLPLPPKVVKERTLLAQEIAAMLRADVEIEDRVQLLSALYLVVPELPLDEPEWLKSFNRAYVAPREHDVAYLLSALERAEPAVLARLGGSGQVLPVAFRPDEPGAFPVAPQQLKRQFTTKEQFLADITSANTRLEHDRALDLPPPGFVLSVFGDGLDTYLGPDAPLTPHLAWPLIVSSLTYAGIPGPYWFAIRRTPDLAQLRAALTRVSGLCPNKSKTRIDSVAEAVRQMERGQSVSLSGVASAHVAAEGTLGERLERLREAVERNAGSPRDPKSAATKILLASAGSTPCGEVVKSLMDGEFTDLSDAARRYWVTKLVEASADEVDVPALIAVIRNSDMKAVYTSARKAISVIDWLSYGPPVG